MDTDVVDRNAALERIAQAGATRAARSLSILTGRSLRIHVPKVRAGSSEDACRAVGGPNAPVLGCSLDVEGDLGGAVLLVFPVPRAYQCVDVMCGRAPGSTRELDELGASALLELGNIVGSTFVNALADELSLGLQPIPPVLRADTAAVLIAHDSAGEAVEDILLIDAVLEDARGTAAGLLVFAPKAGGLERLVAVQP